ncbi:MAG: putative toxin-antitoxin system toxin component, PIN family [Dehalococcoidia bacterium]|nr:putative toxin-antitoxin system toxin component, PIN family [Dehalococcoidia bacterium]
MTFYPMRALFDTNIFISYLLSPTAEGTIATIVEAAVDQAFTLILPGELVERFPTRVASKKYLAQRIKTEDANQLLELLVEVSEIIAPVGRPIPKVCRHVKDDYLLAYALVGRADYLVTGDDDLLVLGEVEGTKVVTPIGFLQVLNETSH